MSEHTEQAAVIQWAMMQNQEQYPELRLLHAIPNGAKLPYAKNKRGGRYSSEAGKLIDEGLKSGVPDLSLPVAQGRLFWSVYRDEGKTQQADAGTIGLYKAIERAWISCSGVLRGG
jgi:hypothetical protein